MIKNIFGRFWALWSLVTFVLTFFIIVLPSLATKLIKDPKGMDWFIKLAKIWTGSWLYLIGCPLTVFGKLNFKEGVTYIVTANHNALLDVPIFCPFIPGANQTIAKDSFTKIPIFGWYYARGSVLVNRKNIASRKKSYDLMKASLKKTFHMGIFPEGSRNKTKEAIASFHDGAFKLAIDTQTPIIPAVIIGTKKAMPIKIPFFVFPTPLQMHFLPPVYCYGKTVESLKQEVHGLMSRFYTDHAK